MAKKPNQADLAGLALLAGNLGGGGMSASLADRRSRYKPEELTPDLVQELTGGNTKGSTMMLSIDGAGTMDSFLVRFHEELQKSKDKAIELGLPTVSLCIHGDIKVGESSGTPQVVGYPIPTLGQVSRAMLEGRFTPITPGDESFQGLESDGYTWNPVGSLLTIVANVHNGQTRFDIYGEDGSLVAQGDLSGISRV